MGQERVTVRLWRRPLDKDRVTVPGGQVHLIVDRCKGCELCVTYCPRDVLEMSDIFNTKGYHPPQVRGGGRCVACGLCEMLCPEFAIFVTEVERGG
jgi:2-oxoglutarate ferredoxin oxidoreductase subunit delta